MKIKKMISFVKKNTWYLLVLVGTLGVFWVFVGGNDDAEFSTTRFAIVEAVERGMVSSGIETTGEIIAAQKLDLDVYRQLSRIDVVNIANGSHVEAGDVLISFDKSDAYVDAESSRVSVVGAELALEAERENAADPSTQIRTLENQIVGYKKSITDAYRDFLNEDLEANPHPSQYDRLIDKTAPTISGRYIGDTEGEYVIETYSSGASSGYSFRLSGLEASTDSVIFGNSIGLGMRGLEITFSTSVRSNDKWVVKVPNTSIATYEETRADYNKTIGDLEVSLVNAEQELADLHTADSSEYRNLSVEQAELALQEARQRLSQNYDVIQERDIVAPFAGTIQDMENVVVGATPVGGTSDTINLGTLISDTFLTTLTLGATDVAKVELGQKVKVTITSFVEQPVFEATIVEVSSLPTSSGVAQYEVLAELDYDRTTSDIVLREGMLADIEVVEEENLHALRISRSALTYENGQPTVQVIDSLTPEQERQMARLGIVRTEGAPVSSYPVTVELGIQGQYFVEILSGLEEGIRILATSVSETQTEPTVQQAGFRGFRGGGGQGGGGNTGGGGNFNGGQGGGQPSR